MSETAGGIDQWDDTIELLYDGELYTKATFQDGEIKKLLNRDRYLKTRWGVLTSIYTVNDEPVTPPGLSDVVAGVAGADHTVGTPFVNQTGTGSTSSIVTITNLKAGDKIAFQVQGYSYITAPATLGYVRFGNTTGPIVIAGMGALIKSTSSTTPDAVHMRGVWTMTADAASQDFRVMLGTNNASGLIRFQGPKSITAVVYRP